MKLKFLSFILLVGAICTADAASAQQNSPTAGGNGGSTFSVLCDQGQVLIGVKGTFGNFINTVEGICATVDEILMPVSAGTTDQAGEPGPTPYVQRCPSGHAVRGLRVATGWYVDSLEIRCGRLEGGGTVSGFNTHPIRAGGGGGDAISNLTCPNALPSRGLVGRAGSWIDRIGLRCEAAAVAAANATGSRPDLRVAIRNYPSIVLNTNRITFRVELWNVGSAAAPSQRSTVDISTPAGSAPTFQQDPSFALAVWCTTAGRCTAHAQIPVGHRMVVRVTMAPPRSTAPIPVSARADVPNEVAELNEGNNLNEQELTMVVPGG